jgi:Delta7-sterol 5-desaturase
MNAATHAVAILSPSTWSVEKMFVGATLHDALRYLLFASVAWLLAYVIFKRRWVSRKIVPAIPEASHMLREIFYSARTVLIFGLVGTMTLLAAKQGWTQMYWKIGEHSNAWFWSSIVISILVHDTYFYWTHRLMHHPKFFRWFHRGHHLSMNPTPWAAYAFDPLEAVVQAGIFPLVVMLYPIHPLAFGTVMLWQIIFNVIGHTGYEFHPRWLMDTWLGKVLNTPTNHAMHHEKMVGNYGLYFNIWDRIMGTNHKDYEHRFREVTTRAKNAANPLI